MRFQVPQFIEVEDKIFGPFTFKQFIYLAGGAGMIVIAWSFLPNFIAFILSLPIAALAIALTFYKVNNRPFVYTLEAYFKYIITGKLFIWKMGQKKEVPAGKAGEQAEEGPMVPLPKLSESRLRDLTWDLGVRGGTGTPADEVKKSIAERSGMASNAPQTSAPEPELSSPESSS